MSTEYTPPDRPTKYVAYGKPRRVGNSDTGEAVDFRPSVFVQEFPSILVKSFTDKTGEHNGERFDFASVVFDASSVGIDGFTRDFGGSVEAEGAAYDLLARAHTEQKPVMLVLETVRRVKRSDNSEQISPLSYIHDLRGAKVDGKKGNAQETGACCKNIVVGVGAAGNPASFAVTSEVHSDPAEWHTLRSNRDHTLPPSGWRVHDGGIIPTSVGTAAGAAVDVDHLVARIAETVKPLATGATENRPRPTQRSAFAVEAKPWEPWNSDGRVNLGGYLPSQERATLNEALGLVTSLDPPADDPLTAAWRLVPLLHQMADQVQTATYGEGARPNRSARSHTEASRWVSWVYTTAADLPGHEPVRFTRAVLDDDQARRSWFTAVVQTASRAFTQAASNVENYLAGADTPPAEADHPAATGETENQAASANPPETAGGGADRHQPAAADAADDDQPPEASLDEWINTAANPALVDRWEKLLATVGQSAHPDRFHPLLQQRFDHWRLGEIPYGEFEAAVAEWEQSPETFVQAAFQAWEKQNPGGRQ